MDRPVVVRSPGYVGLCGGFWTLMLALLVGAFFDPSLKATHDPDWMFWLGVAVISALLARAPFVGLVFDGDRVIHRTWIRSRSWDRDEILRVGQASYSGLLNRYSRSTRFRMLTMSRGNGSVVEIPEVCGRPRKMEERVALITAALQLPPATTPGRHRT